MPEIRSTICRFCHAQCPVHVELEADRVVSLSGVKEHPVYHGYACAKGRELPSFHVAPDRLLRSQRRRPDGTHEPVASEVAMDEIAAKLAGLRERHGPRSVAIYIGTHGYNNLLTANMSNAFMAAFGSPMVFTSVTIDQPGKAVSQALHGTWLAGCASVRDADSWLAVGANPIVSMLGPVNPAYAFREAKARGMQLVVIDPRRTEFAKRADVHLQPRPGQDPALLAGLIRVIIEEGLPDRDFVEANARGFDALREAVEPYTPGYVAARADVPADDLVRAARIYAGGRRGISTVGTGPNMSGHGNLTEYLCKVLMTLCGHWLQAGDRVPNPGVFINWPPPLAQAVDPFPAWGFGEQLRVRGFTDTAAGLPTAALPDEILTDGDGQVRALIVIGGNPMLAWPDQLKTRDALEKLELLVCIDPLMSATGRMADYVIAPRLTFEMPGATVLQEFLGAIQGWGYPVPYAQYAPPLTAPPAGADVIEDWELFFGLGRRLGLEMKLPPATHLDPRTAAAQATPLDLSAEPDAEAMWALLLKDSPVPLAEIKRYPDGHVFEREPLRVQPGDPDATARLDVGNATMMGELAEIANEDWDAADAGYRYRLVSRRLADVLNSAWHTNEKLKRRWKYNPAFMHPADIDDLGLSPGAVIEIESARSSIRGIVEAAPDVRPGVISMTHCFGTAPDEPGDVHEIGSNTGRLSSNDRDYDPYTGIPRMSTIPVNVRPIAVA